MHKLTRKLLLVVSIVLCYLPLSACAPCSLLGRPHLTAGATPTPQPMEISPARVISLERKIEEISHLAPGSSFQLHITEEELTSYVALRLTEVPLQDPCIRITGGKLHATATVTRPIHARVSVVCSARITSSGPKVLFEKATLNGVSIPRFLLNSLGSQVNEVIAQAQLSVNITDIRMREGELLIIGKRKS